jgi:hypothetical protein
VLTPGWVGVDLDGTLAFYAGWVGIEHIGAPIPAMVERVQAWLAHGIPVKIFTARVAEPDEAERAKVIAFIEAWCLEHIGTVLPVTNVKDFGMLELWDDRCVQVEANTGRRVVECAVPA